MIDASDVEQRRSMRFFLVLHTFVEWELRKLRARRSRLGEQPDRGQKATGLRLRRFPSVTR
jgi:hypothetical protein